MKPAIAWPTTAKEIAEWIMGRFQHYGYQDVILDSLQASIEDSIYWQYNVVCSMTGSGAPEEVSIVGGHYDSYSTENLLTQAPGADDNASAVAATLEIARVMKLLNYQRRSSAGLNSKFENRSMSIDLRCPICNANAVPPTRKKPLR
jgi:hypothetical protein